MASEGAMPSSNGRGKKGAEGSRAPASTGSSGAPVPPPPSSFTRSSVPSPPPIPGFWAAPGSSSGASQPPQGNHQSNMWGYPQGGFVNFINQPQFAAQPQPAGENFHFVGLTQAFNPLCPPPSTPYGKGPSPPPIEPEKFVNLDKDADNVVEVTRTGKKRHWTLDEEERLASAWLNTSKDPIHGNDKKSDTFWGQITEVFNRDIEQHLRRDINQLKIHWGRLNKLINEFNGYWSSVTKVNKSGYSDDLLMEEAQKKYKKKHGKPFALVDWWKILRKEPKWRASVAQSEKEKNKGLDVDGTDDGEEERPIGREAAKAQRKGKRKVEEIKDGISMLGDSIDKISKITEERKKERKNVTEAQLEISRNQLEAAKEQKEAKLLEAYTSIVVQDTSQMDEDSKARRLKAMAIMESKLFG